MKLPVKRLATVSTLFSFAVLLGLPAPQLLVAANASSDATVTWSATAPIVYFPILGHEATTGLENQDSHSNAVSTRAVTVPGAPIINSVTPGPGSLSVTWSAPSSNGSRIRSYSVQYSTDNVTWTQVATGSRSQSYTLTGLSSSGYFVEVAATNGVGTGAYSTSFGPVQPLAGATVPGTPAIPSVAAGPGSVSVSWTAPANGGSPITKYAVRYALNGSTSWTVATTTATGSPYTVNGLSSSSSYVFEVAATNVVGTGSYSSASAAVQPLTGATVPDAPAIPSVAAGPGSVKVSWTAPANGGSPITKYAVRYALNGSSSFTVATTTATGSPYTVNGLSSSSSYVFEVAATNVVGTGSYSSASAAVQPLASSNGILYHGGPVLVNSVHVYEIWYGNWGTSAGTARKTLIDTFLKGIGGSNYFNTNHSYYDANGVYVQNSVSVMASTSVSGSSSLNQNSFAPIVANAIASGSLGAADTSGVYYVFTSPDVSVTGFLTQFCGFHSAMTVNSTPLQYSFVGDPTNGMSACSVQATKSPNNDPAGDAMVSVIAHELSESTTDPQLNAWYSSSGNENGDLCAWNFGATFAVANGSQANVTWGTYSYLIQQNWVNASGGYCALSY